MVSRYVLRPNPLRFLIRGFPAYAWDCVKNVGKIAIGRKAYFTPLNRFFRLYLHQLLGGPPAHVTCDLDGFRIEGAGSQAFMMMSALNFARTLGCAYVHTPFTEIDHADRPMTEWAAAWEAHFNFGAGERRAADCGDEVTNFGPSYFLSLLDLFLTPRLSKDPENVPVPIFSAAVVQEFRRKYHSNKPPRPNRKLAVCVHIRRFNRHDSHHDYDMPGGRMARTLLKLQAVLDAHRIEHTIRIFSQGNVSEFPEFARPGVELMLDVDAIQSMQEMVAADILVTSKGSFSYVAAVLCSGIVICDPSLAPQDHWISCLDDRDFDSTVLEQLLRGLAISRAPAPHASGPSA